MFPEPQAFHNARPVLAQALATCFVWAFAGVVWLCTRHGKGDFEAG